MIVLDTSAIVDLLTGGERAALVDAHLIQADGIATPDLVHVEVCSALWRLERAGALSRSAADGAVQRFLTLPIATIPHRGLLARAWRLRESVRIADAFILACAVELETYVLSADARLARGHHGVPVTLVS